MAIAGRSSGRVIVRSTVKGVAPHTRAARSVARLGPGGIPTATTRYATNGTALAATTTATPTGPWNHAQDEPEQFGRQARRRVRPQPAVGQHEVRDERRAAASRASPARAPGHLGSRSASANATPIGTASTVAAAASSNVWATARPNPGSVRTSASLPRPSTSSSADQEQQRHNDHAPARASTRIVAARAVRGR